MNKTLILVGKSEVINEKCTYIKVLKFHSQILTLSLLTVEAVPIFQFNSSPNPAVKQYVA